FTQNDKLGRAFFRMALNGDEISSVFDQTTATQRFALGETRRSATILLFTHEGAKHIWEGPDHLLFLLTLLLPGLLLWGARSVMVAQQPSSAVDDASQNLAAGSSAAAAGKHRAAWVFALKVITAFTLAHSITLAMATLGLISLPDKLIESVIALSIMISALLNLQQRLRINHWLLAFSFGLIHGMGFANGLKELGLSSSYFIETLIAFNVGVELGQLSVVLLVAVPLVWLVRSESGQQRVMRWGSSAVLLISTVWFIQRLIA
ncbi:MAG: HupE/UreJ family protein, partial [Burkholderiaceae bacterium]